MRRDGAVWVSIDGNGESVRRVRIGTLSCGHGSKAATRAFKHDLSMGADR